MNYEEKKAQLAEQIKRVRGQDFALNKSTGNLFRRRQVKGEKLNVKHFNEVISIKDGICEVEGMTTFDDFSKAAIAKGYVPPVVPELKTITIGGAIVGIGIESSSFRYGLVHEMVEELEVLLADGSVVTCSRKKNADLFHALPNSYGTLGYVLKVTIPLVKAKPFVRITHEPFNDHKQFFKSLEQYCKKGDQDYIDASVFSKESMIITRGHFSDKAPYTSDYTYMKRYYKSIQERKEDYLTVYDYLWRWDTDWFWCSKNLGMENNVLRLLAPWMLNSKSYWKIMHINGKYKILDTIKKVFRYKKRKEAVIQDVEIPITHAQEFLDFFHKEIGILPIWICPIEPRDNTNWTLYSMKKQLYMNFGFWDFVQTTKPKGHYNKLIENKVESLKGKKSLYSESFYTEEKFWNLYNKKDYQKLKEKYDPRNKLKDLYVKCVKRR